MVSHMAFETLMNYFQASDYLIMFTFLITDKMMLFKWMPAFHLWKVKWHLHFVVFERLDFSKIVFVWETNLSDNYRENSLA